MDCVWVLGLVGMECVWFFVFLYDFMFMSFDIYFLLLVNVIDLLFDVICVVCVDIQIVFVSVVSECIFGYWFEEMIGWCMFEFMYLDDCECMLEYVQQLMINGELGYFENCYVCKDGSVVDLMWIVCWLEQDGVCVVVV